jgi:hypothetical protein
MISIKKFQITECAKTVQIKLSMTSNFLGHEDKGDYYSMLERFTDWRNIMTVISPDEVLTVLLKARDYDTAKQWCKMKEFTKDMYMVSVFLIHFYTPVLCDWVWRSGIHTGFRTITLVLYIGSLTNLAT